MARNRYDWSRIIELVKEHIEQASSLGELLRAINSRMSPAMPQGTFTSGLPRELKARLDIEYNSFESLRATLSGPAISPLAQGILDRMRSKERRGKALSLISLCEMFDRSPGSVEGAIGEIRDSAYFIEVTDDRHVVMPESLPPTLGRLPIEVWSKPQSIHRYGIVSDTHLCNRKARLDVLESLYDIFVEEGVEVVLLPGNMIDGECKYNRHELVAHGVEGQIAYVANHYPQREGITTQFLTADDHEGWWAKDIGLDIGRRMQNGLHERGRDDLVWIGHMERDLELDPNDPKAVLRIMHPGGGTAYAISYKPQKIAEGWQGGEKPAVAISGHYHKYGAFYPREVFFLLAGCVCDQTMFMRKKPLAAHVGGSIIEVHLSSYGGVTRVRHEWFPFYDRGFYDDWDYSSMWEVPKAGYVGDGQFEIDN